MGVAVLRKTQPNLHRPFRCPAVSIVVPLAVLFCGYLITNLPYTTFIFFGIWTAIGILVYFTYSRHNIIRVEKANNLLNHEE